MAEIEELDNAIKENLLNERGEAEGSGKIISGKNTITYSRNYIQRIRITFLGKERLKDVFGDCSSKVKNKRGEKLIDGQK